MDWIASFLDLAGKWLIGNKNTWGWVVHIMAVIAWAVVAWQAELWGLLASCFIYFAFNIRGLFKWVEGEMEEEKQKTWDDAIQALKDRADSQDSVEGSTFVILGSEDCAEYLENHGKERQKTKMQSL